MASQDENQPESNEPLLHFSLNLNRWLQREKTQTDCLRLVLVGKTGVGKSATGNTILGRNGFKSKLLMKSVTRTCDKKMAKVGERMIQVIDTPGLFDTTFPNEDIKKEIAKCITMSSPGPHVFLLLVSVGRFTNEEMETVRIIQETFGENSKAYTIVGFTRGEEILDDCTSLEEYIENGPPSLQELVKECGGRTQIFCNRDKDIGAQQVQSLLEKIDILIQQNGGSFYTTAMYEETEAKIRAREMGLLQQKLEELENRNRKEKESHLANELAEFKLAMEKGVKNLRDAAEKDKEEDMKKLETLRTDLEKNHDKNIKDIDNIIFNELDKCRNGIRSHAEETEAQVIAQSSKISKKKCIIS